jgi:multiple sugar transport system permease protein
VERYVKYYFTLPALVLIGIIVLFPICYNLYLSLNHWFVASPAGPKWAGLENYVNLLSDARFWNSLRVTVLFTFGALMAQVFLGVLLALFFNRNFKGKTFIKAVFLLPIAATPVAVSLIWAMMYNYDLGIVNMILRHFGLPPPLWLADPDMVIPALIITDTWQWTPLIMLIVLASLESLPQDPFESARVDGANSLKIVYYITLPLVKPAIVVAAMLRSIDALKTFDLIYVMTQGGPDIASENLNLYIFQKGFFYFKMGSASSLAVILFTLVLLVNILLAMFRRSDYAYA